MLHRFTQLTPVTKSHFTKLVFLSSSNRNAACLFVSLELLVLLHHVERLIETPTLEQIIPKTSPWNHLLALMAALPLQLYVRKLFTNAIFESEHSPLVKTNCLSRAHRICKMYITVLIIRQSYSSIIATAIYRGAICRSRTKI